PAALSGAREPPAAGPAVRSGAPGRSGPGVDRCHASRPRSRPGDEPGLRAGVGRVGRGTLDRVGGDPSRGRTGRDGARGGPRRARRRSPLRIPRRRAGMTVLVTGASGLVGSHVVQALVSRGERVRALVRPASRDAVVRLGAEAVVGDVTDVAAWDAAARGADAIVHAAAIVQRRASWTQYVAANVDATRLAVAAARATGARLVHISSVAVYGGTAAYPTTPECRSEDHPFQSIPDSDFHGPTKPMADAAVPR